MTQRAKGWRNATHARSAGLQTGIAAPKGSETPIANPLHDAARQGMAQRHPHQERQAVLPVGHRSAGQFSRWGPSDRHRPRSGRNSHRQSPSWRSRQRGWRNATQARSSPPTGERGNRSAGLQTGIARIAGETPIVNHPHGAAGNEDGVTPPTPEHRPPPREPHRGGLPGGWGVGALASPPGAGSAGVDGSPGVSPARRVRDSRQPWFFPPLSV